MPIPYGVGFRNQHQLLMNSFILVSWDQRGAGKSYNPKIPEQSLNNGQFLSDAKELVEYLKKRFQTNKIFLAGHSWGTIIGMNYISCFPEDIFAYFAMEQIVNSYEADRLAYRWALGKCQTDNQLKRMKTLSHIGQPPYANRSWGIFRQILMRLGAYTYHDKTNQPPSLFASILPALLSPDYSPKDIYKLFIGMRFSYKGNVINDINSVAFDRSIVEIPIPVFFFHGRHDVILPATILEKYFQDLSAPMGKTLFYLQNSAHLYCESDNAVVEREIIRIKEEHLY